MEITNEEQAEAVVSQQLDTTPERSEWEVTLGICRRYAIWLDARKNNRSGGAIECDQLVMSANKTPSARFWGCFCWHIVIIEISRLVELKSNKYEIPI